MSVETGVREKEFIISTETPETPITTERIVLSRGLKAEENETKKIEIDEEGSKELLSSIIAVNETIKSGQLEGEERLEVLKFKIEQCLNLISEKISDGALSLTQRTAERMIKTGSESQDEALESLGNTLLEKVRIAKIEQLQLVTEAE